MLLIFYHYHHLFHLRYISYFTTCLYFVSNRKKLTKQYWHLNSNTSFKNHEQYLIYMLRYFLSVMENLGWCSITIYYTVILKLVLLHAKYILFTDKFFVVVFISSEFYIEK